MSEVIEFVTLHSTEFAVIGAALLAVGGAIVKLTPTKTDDEWWQKLMSAIGKGKK